jgi:hypothetical protein
VIQSASRPAGGSWSSAVDISAIGGHAEDPEVAIDPQGDAVAIWTSVEGSEKVVQAASRPTGGDWSAAVGVSAGGALATRPEVALDAHGDATAVWQYYAGGEEVIQSATRHAGSSWSPPVDVSVTGNGVSFPTVGLDADGDAVAAWIYHDGTNEILESASRPAGGSWSPSLGISAPGEDPEDVSLEVDPRGSNPPWPSTPAVTRWRSGSPKTAREASPAAPGGPSAARGHRRSASRRPPRMCSTPPSPSALRETPWPPGRSPTGRHLSSKEPRCPLGEKGRVKVRARITFTPTGGAASTQIRTLTLRKSKAAK